MLHNTSQSGVLAAISPQTDGTYSFRHATAHLSQADASAFTASEHELRSEANLAVPPEEMPVEHKAALQDTIQL